MVTDIEELEEMDASELHARRLNAQEVLAPMKGDNFILPVVDGTVVEKLDVNFVSRAGSIRETSSRMPFFKFADPLNLGRFLLEGNKDHLLSQARVEIMKQEHQVESLNNCISQLQQQTYAQRLEL